MDIKDVENLAQLSRIDLSDLEKHALLTDLGSILNYVKAVESLSTTDTERDYKLYNIWREDELKPEEYSKDLIIKQFPESQDGFLKVKKIL